MKTILVSVLCIIWAQIILGQPNCQALNDAPCIKACELSNKAAKYQGSKYSQELFDQAIALCPTFAYAYFEKSVPYLKNGLFREWKELIDQAVELDFNYLLNRGINQVQFIRNYKSGLDDLNKLDSLKSSFDIGYSPSGEYHGQLIRAICYQKLGNSTRASKIIEKMVSQSNYNQGLFDFYHLGIVYLEIGELDKSKSAFDRQIEYNELSEVYFYYAQIHEKEGDNKSAIEKLKKAKELYNSGNTMTSSYYHYIDKIYYQDIENAISKSSK